MSNLYLNSNKFLIIVAGPTAVGKTKLAIDLATHYQVEIFSADSRQLYKEMAIGTAKPDKEELSKVRHHFIDTLSIEDEYSVGQYEQDIHKVLEEYFKEKNIAVVTGGTGLYLKSLIEGLDDFPDVPKEVDDYYQSQYETFGLEVLQNQLRIADPEYYAVVDLFNQRRIMRALSVIHVSGRPFSSFLTDNKKNVSPYIIIEILLELPRSELYERINNRVDNMFQAGLLEEARTLYPYKHLRALQTVGYQELFENFGDLITLEEAKEKIKQNTRRYAKRQMTWFRKYGNWRVFHPEQYNEINDYIDCRLKDILNSKVVK